MTTETRVQVPNSRASDFEAHCEEFFSEFDPQREEAGDFWTNFNFWTPEENQKDAVNGFHETFMNE